MTEQSCDDIAMREGRVRGRGIDAVDNRNRTKTAQQLIVSVVSGRHRHLLPVRREALYVRGYQRCARDPCLARAVALTPWEYAIRK